MALWMGALWLVAGTLVGIVGWAAARDRLPRQHWAGIRLPSTVRSDDAWYAAHRAGGPIIESGGALVASMGLLLMVFRPDGNATTLVSLFLAVGLLVAVGGGAVVGVRATRTAS